MSIKIGSDGIDKINSDLIQKDLKRIKKSEKDDTNIASDDKVEISSQALDLQEMKTKAMSYPDVRNDKVEQVKTRIENGTYEISSGKIAERLIEETLEGNF